MRASTREMWEVNKYLWICLLFIAGFVIHGLRHGTIEGPPGLAYSVLAMAVVNGALRSYSAWRRGGHNDTRGWFFTVIDVALISAGVVLTGGIESELWLIYYVVLVSEGLFAGPVGAGILSASMVAGYVAATWPDHGVPGYAATLVTRMFFLWVVGAFARRISADRERHTRELAALREQIATSEERARIAREVHDSLGHSLVSSILRLELCLRLVRRDPAEAETILSEEVPALRAAWNEGRNLAFHLRPWDAGDGPLNESIRRHISRFAERTGLAVETEIDAEEWRLEPETGLALTRILQEALTNIAKHAQASHAWVEVHRDGRSLRCVVRDDGTGFDPMQTAGSFGLAAMRDRAEALGGRVTVRAGPGEGTCIEALLPMR